MATSQKPNARLTPSPTHSAISIETAGKDALFSASTASCDLVHADGMKYSSGDAQILVSPVNVGGATEIGYARFDSSGALTESGLYADSPPAVCIPAFVQEQKRVAPDSVAGEYKLKVNFDGSLEFSYHQGGPDWYHSDLFIDKGQIKAFTTWSGDGSAMIEVHQPEYGLTQAQKDSVQQAVNPNN